MPALSRLLLAALLCLTACDDAPSALGIGRAPVATQPAAPVLPITLTRLYAPSALPAGASSFVEMRLGPGADLDLTQSPLYLVTHAGIAALPQTLWPQNSVLRVAAQTLAPLDLRHNAGELGVIDAQLNLHAYAAWGAAPQLWSQNFVSTAQGRGLSPSKAAGILPYPLDANVAVNLDPNIDSPCVSADPNADTQDATAQLACPAAAAALMLSRVQPAGLDTEQGFVEVYNAANTPVDLHGATLCIDTRCAPIEAPSSDSNTALPLGVLSAATDANTIAPGLDSARALIVVGSGEATSLGAPVLRAFGLAALTAQSEVALFAPGFDPNTQPMAALSYLRFVQADPNNLPLLHMAQSAQAAAWTEQGLSVPQVTGESQARNVSIALSDDPNGWALSRSAPNTSIIDPANPWTACSMPQHPASPQDPLRIVELAQDTTLRIILQNTAAAALDVSGYSLQLGAQTFSLDALGAPLAANASMWIELSATQQQSCSVNQDLCWPGAQAYLDAGAATLLSGAAPVGYVQWGASPGTAAAQAAAYGLWPADACTVANFVVMPAGTQPYRALRLLHNASGQSPVDYFVGLPSRL